MTARQALGMPVPPVAAVRAGAWVRRLLGLGHARTTVPFQLALERAFGLVDTKAIYTAVVLGVPEALAGGPLSATDAAARVGADADALARLLRYLVSRGVFRQRRDGRFANNAVTDVLRADHPYSWRDWTLFMGSPWNTRIWDELPQRVRTGAGATEAALGSDFFTFLASDAGADAGAGAVFNGAMAAGARVQGALFAEHALLQGVTSVCDVGGGTGSALAAVLRQWPAMSGAVLDLASLRADAQEQFAAAGVADRASFRGGDFFASVPSGFDLYTLFAVVHDWGDDDVVRILSCVRAALSPGARVMVVERSMPAGSGEDFVKAADLLMLAYTSGGRERSAAEYEALFARAGFGVQRRSMLPSLFEVFELAPAPPLVSGAR
jgi:SAM-dependent methyltransferase